MTQEIPKQVEQEVFEANQQQEIDVEFMQSLKQNNFIGGTRGADPIPNEVNNQLVDFGDNNMDFNTNNTTSEQNANVKACENVVFDSIFSNDQGKKLLIFITFCFFNCQYFYLLNITIYVNQV